METKPNTADSERNRRREELTYTDPFVFINALHSLKGYLTWQIEEEHILTQRNGLLEEAGEETLLVPVEKKQVNTATKRN